jgi:hypothetical protein
MSGFGRVASTQSRNVRGAIPDLQQSPLTVIRVPHTPHGLSTELE